MIVRRERPADVARVREIVVAAFSGGDGVEPPEATLLDRLRECAEWIPEHSLVAEIDERVVGHVVCTRGRVDTVAGLALGPIAVAPSLQHTGVGTAMMHAALGGGDATDEPFVALLGSPGFYARFGFVPAVDHGIEPPDPAWGHHFQVRPLTGFDPATSGTFAYPAPFDAL